MRDRVRVYREIWSRIENLYFDGYMVSERGLQAALYAEFKILSGVKVIVEPTWEVGVPDLVIVEKEQITDIFELKFKPHHYVSDYSLRWDIQKLLRYGANPDEKYPVRVRPNTGQWEENLPVRNNCRLHFVAVAEHNAAAVWPASLRQVVRDLKEADSQLGENSRVLSHWFGRIGGDTDENREWSIEFGIR